MKKIGLLFFAFLLIGSVQADEHATLKAAVNADHRNAKNTARDSFRHPLETLAFFGIKPDMQVLEILPGRGWYTEILAPYLKDSGKLTAASFGANHPSDYLRSVHMAFEELMNSNKTLYGDVNTVVFEQNGYLNDVADESQDMVVTFRNTHNWIRYGGIEQIYQSFHRVLKKGGVLGVVQHRAAAGSDHKQSAEKGYVPESYLIKLLEDIGFELVAKSEVNANPKDTKDYKEGVWSLPPSYREKDNNREKYSAIGESDRMTLRFVKL